ncbi:hypothetical protein 2 [Hubei sobemo-like virus 40]|uniref:hypothetical protein 2 n=1 Tax=Hubei sobemo-like virus 40 TaxID=1923228 RepID=UPI000909A5D7|nr:hypothetical protein 2 [Hubei sobemo-like virus 40]APG75800.1 hypothetical protein 2 [Hubei sobemo-like virus 40]
MTQAPTIGEWLFKGELEPDPTRKELLWLMVTDVIEGNYEHLFRVFVKHEPHTERKALAKRWRLIIASSLPVQIVWQMVFGNIEDALLQQTGRTPSAYGLVYGAGGWKRFRDMLVQRKVNLCVDKSGWDMNSPGWVYELCLELRKRLCTDLTPAAERVMDMLYRDAYQSSKLIFGDGTILEQQFSGFMKSGLFVTISDNSFSQYFLHVLACLRLRIPLGTFYATGDDTIQSLPPNVEEYLDHLEYAGCEVKEYMNGYQFMGFELKDYGPHPIYLGKHFWNLLHQEDENLEQTIDSYLLNYCKVDEAFDYLRALSIELGYAPRSKQWYRFLMDNPLALEGNWTRPGFVDPASRLG